MKENITSAGTTDTSFTIVQAAEGFTSAAAGSNIERNALVVWLSLCKDEKDFDEVYATVGKNPAYKKKIRDEKKLRKQIGT